MRRECPDETRYDPRCIFQRNAPPRKYGVTEFASEGQLECPHQHTGASEIASRIIPSRGIETNLYPMIGERYTWPRHACRSLTRNGELYHTALPYNQGQSDLESELAHNPKSRRHYSTFLPVRDTNIFSQNSTEWRG